MELAFVIFIRLWVPGAAFRRVATHVAPLDVYIF